MEITVNADPQGLLGNIRCFLLDLDGTFYLGNQLLEGSLPFIRRLEETGRTYVFLTNNSSKSGEDYRRKLAAMGLEVKAVQIVTSGQATAEMLLREYPGQRVFLLGNPALEQEFQALGVPLDQHHPQLVVTAFDTTLDYPKLCQLCDFVRAGLPYLATHPDFNCPTENGPVPDIGAVHAFVHASTGRMPDRVVGKPNRGILDYALAQAGCAAGEAAMVGDRLYTDIASTRNLPGLTGVLVLSGETELKDLEAAQVQPHLIFDSLGEMIPLL